MQFAKPPKAKLALFFNSEGVAAGSAMITAKQSLLKSDPRGGLVRENGILRERKTYRTFSTT